MVSLKLLILSSLLFLTSCAKLGYLINQGIGQVKIQTKAKSNEKLLKDVQVSKAKKKKIKLIQVYKKYFYEYYGLKSTEIYDKTTMLDQKAVTYLIIASPKREIKPIKHCFPFMGCFPYLGFFKETDAFEFMEELSKKELYVYKRPVYAYSTLGHMTDPILSSFFYYSEYDLAELIFHELFHTILFVKDKVKFNENLATYFSEIMALEYFQDNPKILEKTEKRREQRKEISKMIVKLVKNYKNLLAENNQEDLRVIDQKMRDFVKESLKPELLRLCEKYQDKKCKIAERDWNHASFSAYLTYQDKIQDLKRLHEKLNISLKDFFFYIKKKHDLYEGETFVKDLLAGTL